MGEAHYARLWLEACGDLEKLMADDKVVQEGEPIEDSEVATNAVLKLYFRYRRMVRRLTSCHDQIVQPQIRELLGKQLDCSIARMLECRRELVDLTCLECPWPHDVLLDMKLTPEDVRLTAPAYDAAAREAEAARRRGVVEAAARRESRFQLPRSSCRLDGAESDLSLRARRSLAEPPRLCQLTYASEAEGSRTGFRTRRPRAKSQATVPVVDVAPVETPEKKRQCEAVTLIQSHERARVGRRAARAAVADRELRARLAMDELRPRTATPAEQTRAASVIQRGWRRLRARLHFERRIEQLEELLGMTMPSWRPRDAQLLGELAFRERLDMQLRAAELRDREVAAQRERLWQVRGPALVEDVRDEVRQWLLLWFDELGHFDSVPAPEDGGSLLIATGQVRTPAEYLAAPADAAAGKKPARESPTDAEEEEEEEEPVEPEGWQMSPSRAFPLLAEASAEFAERWSRRAEEQVLDPRAALIAELSTEPLCHELQLEMRRAADEAMRAQLDELNRALAADALEDGAPFAPPKPQTFPRPEAAPTPKARPEPLAGESEDELLLELSRQEVLRDCPRERLSDWPGALSHEVRADAAARLGDLLLPVMDYCVLPLGSRRLSGLAPAVRSVCLCGPPGCGQLFVARAVCAELKATVFDLTPERHVGRFLRRAQQERLAQAVLRLSRACAPSVVLVEGESAFLRWVPPELRPAQPKRFAAVYRKIVRGIAPGDQVLFLTASQQPYMAARSFVKLHDKFIVVPVADRGTLYRLFKHGLMRRPNVHRHVDVSCLASVCAASGTPLELADQALELATSIGRRIRLKRQPLRPAEILEQLFRLGLPCREVDSFAKFRAKLPLELRRQELEQQLAERQQDKSNKR
ncbi:IQ and AAA domain-containing protein 1-like [Phymastichus coffea]|uniref:IQ and AAA domain-containing protein 1-like n=1 Tax=Phymastichus coffea TaxID=108790 RepID=UPI00273B684D|nr:IQ and AAA domain-containing protein 1-like [Phymastichus coffea]